MFANMFMFVNMIHEHETGAGGRRWPRNCMKDACPW